MSWVHCCWQCCLRKALARLELSRAKHRSLAGHARWSRRFAALVPFYEYDESQFFTRDDAPDDVARTRRAGFMRLASIYAERFPKSAQMNAEVEGTISDMQFTSRYRVPFQYSKLRAQASQGRLVPRVVVRRDRHRSRRQSALRSRRLLRRERVRIRLLQGVHRRRQRAREGSRSGARRRIIRCSRTTCAG